MQELTPHALGLMIDVRSYSEGHLPNGVCFETATPRGVPGIERKLPHGDL